MQIKEGVLCPRNLTMHPLVFTYLVRYEFSHGVEYVSLARGALSGMAQAVWLNSGHTSDEAVNGCQVLL